MVVCDTLEQEGEIIHTIKTVEVKDRIIDENWFGS